MFGPRGAGSSRSSDDLHNEDAYLVADEIGLYAVCDGRGDAPGGEVAAYLAVDALSEYLDGILRLEDGGREGDRVAASLAATVSCRTIEAAIRFALENIVDAAETRPDLEGMATTVTLLLIQKGRAYIGHVGDSRAYLVRAEQLVQLTTDQEWTATETPLGDDAPSPIETFSLATRPGDTFVLCTDGAEMEVGNADLLEAIEDYSPRLIASRLVASAHRHHPEEDATAVVVRIRDDREFARVVAAGPPALDGYGRGLVHRSVPRSFRPLAPFDHLMDRSARADGRGAPKRSEPV